MTAASEALAKPVISPKVSLAADKNASLEKRVQSLREKNVWLRSNCSDLSAQANYWRKHIAAGTVPDGVMTADMTVACEEAAVEETTDMEQIAAALQENNDALRVSKHAIVAEIASLEQQYVAGKRSGVAPTAVPTTSLTTAAAAAAATEDQTAVSAAAAVTKVVIAPEDVKSVELAAEAVNAVPTIISAKSAASTAQAAAAAGEEKAAELAAQASEKDETVEFNAKDGENSKKKEEEKKSKKAEKQSSCSCM